MTAYERRISDWSSDVCSSDLEVHQDLLHQQPVGAQLRHRGIGRHGHLEAAQARDRLHHAPAGLEALAEIRQRLAVRLATVRLRPGEIQDPVDQLQENVAAGVNVLDVVAVLAAQRAERLPLHEVAHPRSEEHTSELQSLMRNSYAVFCLKKK